MGRARRSDAARDRRGLAERPRAVSELAAELPVSRPAVSQHLKVLKDAGLVSERPRAPAASTGSTRPASRRCGTSSTRSGAEPWPATEDAVDEPTQDERHDPGSSRSRPQAHRRRGTLRARPSRCSPTGSATSSRRSTTCSAAPIAETVFEPRVGGHIYDRARTAACAAGHGSSSTTRPPGRVQLGHRPDLAARDRPGRTPARSRSDSSRRPRPHPRRARAPPHRPPRPRLGGRRRRRRPTTRAGRCTSPGTRLCSAARGI